METYDLYNLQDDVLYKSNESFYDFVEKVTGKVEADILRVQGIRNARCLVRSKDLLAILELDCDEINKLKPHACFRCSTGDLIIRQGVQLNLDNLFDVLKDKHEKYKKKTQQHQRQYESPSTNLDNNNSSILQNTTVEMIISDSSNACFIPSSTSSSISTSKYKTTNDHVIFIKDLLEKFSRKTFMSTILKQNEHYDLTVMEEGQSLKAIVKCQCGTKIMLPTRSDTSTFILSNFYSHLTTSNCSMVNQIFKEQETVSTEQLEAPSSSTSVPKSPISASNSYASNPEKQSKRKHLYNISSTTMSNTNKKKKQKK